MKSKGKAYAITLSDLDSLNYDSDESCDGEGNYFAFMAIAYVESLEALNLLVQELGEHSDEESIGVVEKLDAEEDENVACLQENYKTIAKKSDKRMKMDNTKFKSTNHFERYTQFYLKAPIIQERFVDLVDLKDTFIPSCFQDRGWNKLLSDLSGVCEPLIREFYANAVLREDEINC